MTFRFFRPAEVLLRQPETDKLYADYRFIFFVSSESHIFHTDHNPIYLCTLDMQTTTSFCLLTHSKLQIWYIDHNLLAFVCPLESQM